MTFKSFIDSDTHGTGAFTTRLWFTAVVNALDYYAIRVYESPAPGVIAELDPQALSAKDHAQIYAALEFARQEERKRTQADREWLSSYAREGRGA